MAIFKLDTDQVSNTASSINSIADKMSSLADMVSGYSIDGDFSSQFSSAKSVIAQNIEACSVKLYNTVTYMKSVVESHTQLQNSVLEAEETTTDDSSTDDTSYYPSGYVYAGGASVISAPILTQQEEKVEEEPIIESISHVTLDVKKMSEDSKTFLGAEGPKYKDGYAIYGDRPLVACDASIGKVGDVIRVTREDGTTVECVVGVNTYGEKYKNKLNFIVEDGAEFNEEYEHLLRNVDKIENCGNVNSLDDKTTKESEFKEIKFVEEEDVTKGEGNGTLKETVDSGEIGKVESETSVEVDNKVVKAESESHVEADNKVANDEVETTNETKSE